MHRVEQIGRLEETIEVITVAIVFEQQSISACEKSFELCISGGLSYLPKRRQGRPLEKKG